MNLSYLDLLTHQISNHTQVTNLFMISCTPPSSSSSSSSSSSLCVSVYFSGPVPKYPFLTILRLDKHEGLSVAKNKGARLAINEFDATHLVFLEAHCDAQPVTTKHMYIFIMRFSHRRS